MTYWLVIVGPMLVRPNSTSDSFVCVSLACDRIVMTIHLLVKIQLVQIPGD